MWLKMSEVAKELNVTKDVIKYHRKSLPEETVKKENGEVYISTEGMTIIQSKLKKETYNAHFETYVRKSLRQLDGRLDTVTSLLIKLILANGSQSTHEMTTKDISYELINITQNQSFQEWYCHKNQLPYWEEQKLSEVTVLDIVDFSKQFRG